MGCLEIKHLRMISAIADTGNMTRAAQHLCISQSGLSQQLKHIENKLAVDLFFRTPKRMIPTAMGHQLLATASAVIDTVEAAETIIERAVSGEAGEFRIGVHCIFCYKWLPHVMERFQRQFPGIDVEIGNASDAGRELLSKRFDIVISAVSAGDDTFAQEPLFEDQLVCIMAVDHPLSERPFVRYADFQHHKFITHVEKAQSRFYQQALQSREIEPRGVMTVSSPQAIVAMVSADLGLSISPAWAIRSAVETRCVCARPITRSGLPVTWRAVYLKSGQMPVYQQAFIRDITHLDVAGIGALPDNPAPAA